MLPQHVTTMTIRQILAQLFYWQDQPRQWSSGVVVGGTNSKQNGSGKLVLRTHAW